MWQLLPSTALLLLGLPEHGWVRELRPCHTRAESSPDLLFCSVFVSLFCLAVSAGTQAADLPKAVVVLESKWNRVLTMDSVTLKCQGDHLLRDNYTWLHNGRPISNQISTYFIKNASIKNSGEYRCQTDLSKLSDPVQLEVHTGWLLLQVPRLVFQEGELIQLKCHSWKNTPVRNVQYFQNGRGKKFFYNNSEYHIPAATSEHNGSYFCRGIIGKKNESSEAVNIIIQVDTGLYFAVQRDLRSSMGSLKNSKVVWSQGS
ncbi:low affinity immunoglobulin gamma Fc region receptor III-A isoform X3 [Vulpes vulpes]|uniref:low affinity immunoglobulin gamma Fc region receptor III-A isoform X3 n=1 Tax=Vulpes vulpes TaxID=9627 RepID=UPI003B97B485